MIGDPVGDALVDTGAGGAMLRAAAAVSAAIIAVSEIAGADSIWGGDDSDGRAVGGIICSGIDSAVGCGTTNAGAAVGTGGGANVAASSGGNAGVAIGAGSGVAIAIAVGSTGAAVGRAGIATAASAVGVGLSGVGAGAIVAVGNVLPLVLLLSRNGAFPSVPCNALPRLQCVPPGSVVAELFCGEANP